VQVTDIDRACLRSLYEFATGVDLDDCDYDDNEEEEEERYAVNWCWNVLAALGLIEKRDGKHWGFKPTPRLKRLFESVPVVKEHIEQIKRLSAQSSNILYLNTTRDPEVSEKSSTASVVPPQPDETPLEPSPPSRVASANSIEGAADHPRRIETHLRQVLQSVGGYHDALARFWGAGVAILQ
jgi:hypothetical protein